MRASLTPSNFTDYIICKSKPCTVSFLRHQRRAGFHQFTTFRVQEDTYEVPNQGDADHSVRDRGQDKPGDNDDFDPLEIDNLLHHTIAYTRPETAYLNEKILILRDRNGEGEHYPRN
jgi:hypothetical protein